MKLYEFKVNGEKICYTCNNITEAFEKLKLDKPDIKGEDINSFKANGLNVTKKYWELK